MEKLRNARSVSDLTASMGKIRIPMDTVINFKNDPDFQSLVKELFIDTNVINDIPGLQTGGTLIASQNIRQFMEAVSGFIKH